jgi:hypothetical protein
MPLLPGDNQAAAPLLGGVNAKRTRKKGYRII